MKHGDRLTSRAASKDEFQQTESPFYHTIFFDSAKFPNLFVRLLAYQKLAFVVALFAARKAARN